MKLLHCLTFIAVICVGCGGGQQLSEQPPAQRNSEDQEPPQLFFLEFDGKRIPIELNKPLGTDALGKARAVTLRVEPYRIFRIADLSFHYPREYTFETNFESPGVATWVLSGNHCKILVQRFKARKNHEAVLKEVKEELIALYKNSKTKVTPVTLNIKGMELKGERLEVRLVATVIRQDIYAVPSGKDSIVLYIQDTPQDNGDPSADRVLTEKLFRETVRFPDN